MSHQVGLFVSPFRVTSHGNGVVLEVICFEITGANRMVKALSTQYAECKSAESKMSTLVTARTCALKQAGIEI